MLEIDIKIDEKTKKIKINKNVLFNSQLVSHPKLIKKLIKHVNRSYKISDDFFEIINNYIDYNKEGRLLYSGLIVRTGLDNYAVLYLKNTKIDEEYMIKIINDYIFDIADHIPSELIIDKFEIDVKTFLNVTF